MTSKTRLHFSFLSLSLLFFLLLSATPAGADQSVDKLVWIEQSNHGNGATFTVNMHRALECTITFRCNKMTNLSSDQELPYTFVDNKPDEKFEFLHFTQADRRYDWDTSWVYHVNIGAPSKRRTEDYAYRLPYSSDEHYNINQSYGGTFSHFVGSDSEYAIDFGLPEGTKVLAARAGTVIAYRSDSDVGGNSSAFENHENYVVIKHDDGTYANYSHFKKDGVLVSLGQFVTEGTPIGLSGATGFASQPHLHFVVYRVVDGDKRPSLPFTTRTQNGLVKQLEKDQVY